MGAALKKAGLAGSMDELRARAYLDLLLDKDSRPAAPAPDNTSSASGETGNTGASGGGAGTGGPGDGESGSPDPAAPMTPPGAGARPSGFAAGCT